MPREAKYRQCGKNCFGVPPTQPPPKKNRDLPETVQPLIISFYHVHNERTDDCSLAYAVQLNTNLVDGTWTTNGVDFVGESVITNNFKSVTNRTDVGSSEFMRLRIGQL